MSRSISKTNREINTINNKKIIKMLLGIIWFIFLSHSIIFVLVNTIMVAKSARAF